jgi:F-type H+-transporting ATPase subunit a
MGEHEPGYVTWLTEHFYALIDSFGLHLKHVPLVHLWMVLFIFIFLLALFGYWSKRYQIYPSFMQQILETYFDFIRNLVDDVIGPHGREYIPLIGTLGLFILFSNLMGLVPIFVAPTSNINVPCACALFVFVYYHYQGIRKQGIVNYLKHFAGPVWWLAPLFIPVELIGHLARPVSLTFRLFGNIFGEELVIAILFGLVAFIVPLPIMCLAIFTSLIQTLVFIMLSCIYIAGAVAHEEGHEEHEEEHVPELAHA